MIVGVRGSTAEQTGSTPVQIARFIPLSNPTYLCRTRYILRFINDVNLRQAEQQLWNECPRLIANAIIHYNTALLSRVYEQKRAAGHQAAMELIAAMSLVAWLTADSTKLDMAARHGGRGPCNSR